MFFFRHPKPVRDSKEVAVLVQQSVATPKVAVLIAKEPRKQAQFEAQQEMQSGDASAPPPA